MEPSVRIKRCFVIGLTLMITAYLVYRVYSEASQINLSLSDFLSVYTLLAFILGIVGYLVYTAAWYVYLRGVSDASFKRVLLANLSGTYLAFSLSAAVGTLIKVKFIGASYFEVLATSLMEISTEFLVGFALVFAFTRSIPALAVFLFFVAAFVADRWLYAAVSWPFKKFHRGEEAIENFYRGWRKAKSDPKRVALAMLLGTALVLVNALMLGSVARVFGVELGLVPLIKAILYSEFLGGALGTPGGLGGNELGVLMAIGNTGLNVVVAFFFKFINQYMFALIGAVAFYRFVMAEVRAGKGL